MLVFAATGHGRLDAVADELRPLLGRCLDPEPEARPGLPELLVAFAGLANGLPPGLTADLEAMAADPRLPERPTATRRQALTGIAVSAALLAGVGVGVRAAVKGDEGTEGPAPDVMGAGEARYAAMPRAFPERLTTVRPAGGDGWLRGPYFQLQMERVRIADRLRWGEAYVWRFRSQGGVVPAEGCELVLVGFERGPTGGPWRAEIDEAKGLLKVAVRTSAGRHTVTGVYAPDVWHTNLTHTPGTILACVPKSGRALLEVTSQGRTQSMDLRTGRPADVVTGYDAPLPAVSFTGGPYDATARVSAYGRTRRARLAVRFGTATVTFAPWAPGLGWAREGRAWLVAGLPVETWLDTPGDDIDMEAELEESRRSFPLGGGRFRVDGSFTFRSGGTTYRPALPGGDAVKWGRLAVVPYTAVLAFDLPAGRLSGTLEFRPDVTLTGRFLIGGEETDVPVTWESRFPARRLSLRVR